MSKRSMECSGFLLPPCLVTERGTKRHVGFELEFSGLNIQGIATTLVRLFGGTVHTLNPYKLYVKDTDYGTFTVELDFRWLKETVLKEKLGELGFDQQEDLELISLFEEILATFSEIVVPYEIVTPPIFIDELGIMDKLENELRLEGALGTGALPFYAFGLHINPEVPSFEISSILNHLRAFLLLYEWIVKQTKTDVFRQMTPYINPFEKEYVVQVLDPDYHPGQEQLMVDYLLANPTRNRPLDLLPLFMVMDKRLVKEMIDDPNVKARPTFHYRLPDCRIDEPGEDICEAWNYWVEVEKLADNEAMLKAMSMEYLDYLEDPFAFFGPDWPERVDAWLK